MSDFNMKDAPATIGDLRRRLEALGNPWTVPGRYNDEDPLPNPPRGGRLSQGGRVPSVPVRSAEEFKAHLRTVPPSNPFLIERWRELGLLPAATGADDPTASAVRATDEWGVA